MKKGFNRKKCVIEYPNIPSAIRPVPHSDELPIPEPRKIRRSVEFRRCRKQ